MSTAASQGQGDSLAQRRCPTNEDGNGERLDLRTSPLRAEGGSRITLVEYIVGRPWRCLHYSLPSGLGYPSAAIRGL